MPWREAARPLSPSYIADPNIRGYSCLVSEVMLQQTQVANCAALGQFFPRGGAGGLVWSWILLEGSETQ